MAATSARTPCSAEWHFCVAPNLPERIEVQNGQFAYPFQVNPPRVAPLHVQIFEDGTLARSDAVRHMLHENLPMFFFPRIGLGDTTRTITGAAPSHDHRHPLCSDG